MTNEEAIQELEFILVGHPETSAIGQAVLIAIEALEKQIPKKVKAHQDCPNCGADVIGSGFYCWNCGQRLYWEVEI